MANLTLRQTKGSPLTITEMDGNFEYFTGSYTNTGTITAQGFSGSFTGSLQGTVQTASYVQTAQTASYVQTAQTASYVVNLNQNVIISGSLLISGSIIPNTNGISSTSSFNLGSPTNAWKDIYVSNGTINFLDGAGNVQGELSSTANGLSTNGDAYFNEIRTGQGPATGSGNIVVGKNSFLATSSLQRLGNTAIGNEVLTYYIGGSSGINYYNTSVGYFSLSNLTTGGQNTSIGMSALRNATAGYTNTAVGYSSLVSLISGSSNVGVGANALYDLINGYQNTSIGDSSLVSITNGFNNTAIGWFAGRYASASSAGNVYLGFNAGPSSNIVQNNKLYINNQYGDPLIGGDFNAKTVTISGSLLMSGSIIPNVGSGSTTSSFNLGSPTNAWKDIYVSQGTINFLDGAGNVQGTVGAGAAGTVITGSLSVISYGNEELNLTNQGYTNGVFTQLPKQRLTSAGIKLSSLTSGLSLNAGLYTYFSDPILPWNKKITSFYVYNNLSSSMSPSLLYLPPIYNSPYTPGEIITVYNISPSSSANIKNSGSLKISCFGQGVLGVDTGSKSVTSVLNGQCPILSGSWGNYYSINSSFGYSSSLEILPGKKASFEIFNQGFLLIFFCIVLNPNTY
jgi:hypothetical protein